MTQYHPVFSPFARAVGRWLRKRVMQRRDPDFVLQDADDGRVYLRRWWLIPRNRFFNVYLHEFLGSDDPRALHDHPWHSLTWALDGQYNEITFARKVDPEASKLGIYPEREVELLRAGQTRFRKASHAHIVQLDGDVFYTQQEHDPDDRTWFWRNGYISHLDQPVERRPGLDPTTTRGGHTGLCAYTTAQPALTIFITGPITRMWGFWSPVGWIDFRRYNREYGRYNPPRP